MADNPPYLVSPGSLKNALEKIKAASTPPRFTGDFVETVIGVKGGAGRALIPFFKRIGFVKSDGSPSELYNQFRNPSTSMNAAAEAFRIGFKSLYQFNEYIHQAKDDEVKGAIIQATGLEADSRVVQAIFGTFKTLKSFANFEVRLDPERKEGLPAAALPPVERNDDGKPEPTSNKHSGRQLNLSYTVTLNLPASDDIRVFDAIFRSLKENLLKE